MHLPWTDRVVEHGSLTARAPQMIVIRSERSREICVESSAMNGAKTARMEETHVPAVAALQRACFPEPFSADLLWTSDHLKRHIELFRDGQFVALADGTVVASASSCI